MMTIANQTSLAKEAERKKKKEEEAAAAAALATALEAARKEREVAEKQLTGIQLDDDFTMDDVLIEGLTNGMGTNSTLDCITRNLEAEVTSPVNKRRNVEVSSGDGGTYAAVASTGSILHPSSFAPHNHIHKRVILNCSVGLDQDDKFTQFLCQIAGLITNGKVMDRFFVINLVLMGTTRKDWKEVWDIPQNMTVLGGHIKISQKSLRSFEKKSFFGSTAKKRGGNAYMDTVYFTVAISCDVQPLDLVGGI